MATKLAYRLTGFVVLLLGVLFFLRDIGVNFIGNTSGWTIFIVLIGAGLFASGSIELKKLSKANLSKLKS